MTRTFASIVIVLATASTLLAAEPRRVAIAASDSFSLSGNYRAGRAKSPAVLLLHQCDRAADAPTGFEKLAADLSDRGWSVLELDSRGFGGSRSQKYRSFRDQMDLLTPYLAKDAASAYRWLQKESGASASRTAVVAASCGASQAILLAGAGEVGPLVLISPSVWQDARAKLDALAARPVLTIYATQDRFARSTPDLAAASKHERSKIEAYHGALHGTPLIDANPTMIRSIGNWLARELSAAPAAD